MQSLYANTRQLAMVGSLLGAALVVGPGPAAALAQSGDPAHVYDVAMGLAKSAQTPAEIDSAARVLTALMPRYPQDGEIPLQLGWLQFRAGRYAEAVQSYSLSVARSSGGGDAELGLGWSLLKLGRCDEARPHFRAVLAARGGQGNAADGLRECDAPAAALAPAASSADASQPKTASTPAAKRWWLQPQLGQNVYLFQNQSVIKSGLATTARLDGLFLGRYYASAAYRYSYFSARDGKTVPWDQHDLYLSAGLTAKSAGLTLHYALVADHSGYTGTSHHLGLSGRYSYYADLLLNGSASFYSDEKVLRGELAVRMPIGRGFSVRPGFALQWAATMTTTATATTITTTAYKTPSLTLMWDHRFVSLWAGGKYGDEKRPALFAVSYIYNGAAVMPYGAWFGITARSRAALNTTLSYSYDRMQRRDLNPVQDTHFHAIFLSLSKEF